MLDHITYTDTFFNELNPHSMRFIASLRGFEVPDSTSFTCTELGCGTGHSLIVFAAANPSAHFIGIDFNEDHIAHANKRAKSLGVENCQFMHTDITKIDQLPMSDYIVMHGLYTWVHQSVRDAIHRLIENSLSDHGIVLVSYNTYPGWHIYEPLRMMLREYSMNLSEDPFYNAEQGIGFLEWMHERNSEYMKAVPSAGAFIQELAKHDVKYIIHEYYADHWTPLWFTEMESKMSDSGLTFAGQIPMYLNSGAISLPDGFEDMLALEEDIVRFETFKDLIRNTMFRWDIYAKKRSQSQNPFESIHVGIVQNGAHFHETITLPHCKPIQLDIAFHEPIMNALQKNATTVDDIIASCKDQHLTASHIHMAIHNLLMTEQIKPLPTAKHDDQTIITFKQIIMGFLEEALIQSEHVIPSIYSGSGIHINQDTALMLIASIKHADDPIEWIAEWMEIHGYGEYSEVHEKAQRAYQDFEHTIPFWKKMHIM